MEAAQFLQSNSHRNLEAQCKFYKDLEVIKTRGLEISSLGSKQYSNKAPLLGVHELMNDCEGVVILSLKQIVVHQCIEKEGTDKEDREKGFLSTDAMESSRSRNCFCTQSSTLNYT